MRALASVAALAIASATIAAQQPLFRSSVDVVTLDVSVTRGGRPVPGLTARDFVLSDNGVAQELDSVTLEQMPISVTLVLDLSASVSGYRQAQLAGAGHDLAAALRAGDRVALITFSHRVELKVPLTGDTSALRGSLKDLNASGGTALRDALHLAVQVQHTDRGGALILVFSDGDDTASWLSEEEVLQSVRQSRTVAHIVRLQPNRFLDRLADASGGRTWSATSDSQLRELFTRALDEMRGRYLLTYTPRGVARPGWHAVNVTLRGRRADITARPGYFVPEQ